MFVHMNPWNISKEFLVESLHVLVMSDMRIENGHLAAAYTGKKKPGSPLYILRPERECLSQDEKSCQSSISVSRNFLSNFNSM